MRVRRDNIKVLPQEKLKHVNISGSTVTPSLGICEGEVTCDIQAMNVWCGRGVWLKRF
ncbi:MAG: hypothetical protein ACTS43_02035 [Candidatus Hodgkinia cicadicola]